MKPNQVIPGISLEKYTPVIQQYLQIKRKYPNYLLFFRMGDFYELFFDDAHEASRLLDIVVSSRGKTNGNKIPMAGVPAHAAESYLGKLLQCGKSVVICEQTGESASYRAPMTREVTRILTPGTVVEDHLVSKEVETLLATIHCTDKTQMVGLACLNMSNGYVELYEFQQWQTLVEKLQQLQPAELIYSDQATKMIQEITCAGASTPCPKHYFNWENTRHLITEQYPGHTLDSLGCGQLSHATPALGALLQYLRDTHLKQCPHLRKPHLYRDENYLMLDAASRRNLELQHSLTNTPQATLLGVLDTCVTTMGRRLLRNWLRNLSRNHNVLQERYQAVAELMQDCDLAEFIRLLKEIGDLERIHTRITLRSATPRDLTRLRTTLQILPALVTQLQATRSVRLQTLYRRLPADMGEALDLLEKAISDSPPVKIRDGNIIRNGYNEKLDELRSLSIDASNFITELEQKERAQTGISNLKIKYNRLQGYFIEVSKHQQQRIPAHYNRKQTLKAVERFVIPELQDFEKKILYARESSLQYEVQLYEQLLELLETQHANSIQLCAQVIAELDVLCCFAERADRFNWQQPTLTEQTGIEIIQGRHPVVEAMQSAPFIANDLTLHQEQRMLIITGPNMGGKSTYMRQLALIVIMAHLGSRVPAERAQIGIIDRIFTRIGASDDLAGGRSTFMVEMTETAYILHHATANSLVLMDEVGRGTGTNDGLALAWACAWSLLHQQQALVLFATHYFEMTCFATEEDGADNIHTDAMEDGQQIVFLYHIKSGPADRSYGIQVAALAGLPANVIEHAKKLQAAQENTTAGNHKIPVTKAAEATTEKTPPHYSPLITLLDNTSPDELSPREALELLYTLKKLAADNDAS